MFIKVNTFFEKCVKGKIMNSNQWFKQGDKRWFREFATGITFKSEIKWQNIGKSMAM
jgi:hypothetical protein